MGFISVYTKIKNAILYTLIIDNVRVIHNKIKKIMPFN